MSSGLVVVASALAATVLLAALLARPRGFRATRRSRSHPPADAAGPALAETPFADALGPSATLVHFSSAFCAPCRAVRQVVGHAVTQRQGVAHIEVDAEQNLDLVRRLGIMRTPTTLLLDRQGVEVTRASGVPRLAEVLAAVDALES